MLRQEIRGIQRAQSNFYGRKWMRAPVMTNKPSYIIVRHAWMNLQKHAGVISAYISVFGVTCLGSWFGTPRVFRTVPQNSIQIHALQYTVKSNIYMYIYIYYISIYTSSTAQGGGGSFKNDKPIGEVSCCGAKMAERTHWWIERWLSVSPFLSLFLSFSLSLSFSPSIYRVTFLAIYLSTCLFM